jgi:hypothetical protein
MGTPAVIKGNEVIAIRPRHGKGPASGAWHGAQKTAHHQSIADDRR